MKMFGSQMIDGFLKKQAGGSIILKTCHKTQLLELRMVVKLLKKNWKQEKLDNFGIKAETTVKATST